jgi:hypothetical protein
LRRSWTRWLQSRRERRQAKLQLLLRPLLLEALTPVAQAMQRLDSRQQELACLVVQLPAEMQGRHLETQELLLEVLQSLQPPPQQEIARRLGLPAPPISSPSSPA